MLKIGQHTTMNKTPPAQHLDPINLNWDVYGIGHPNLMNKDELKEA